VRRETKGRGGKTVTVITGLPLSPEALEPVGRALRQACGSGGTTRDDTIEVQGDHVQTVLAWLQKQGWKARAG
jgi:translation initiation factor 1